MGRIPYWGCKSNLCGADLEGGGASNLTGADRGRMWIGAVSPASAGGWRGVGREDGVWALAMFAIMCSESWLMVGNLMSQLCLTCSPPS